MDLFKEIEGDLAEIGIIYPSRFSYTELSEFYTLLAKLKSLALKCGSDINNNHYTICPWSNKSCQCGPDTCLCVVLRFTFFEIKKKLLLVKQRSLIT